MNKDDKELFSRVARKSIKNKILFFPSGVDILRINDELLSNHLRFFSIDDYVAFKLYNIESYNLTCVYMLSVSSSFAKFKSEIREDHRDLILSKMEFIRKWVKEYTDYNFRSDKQQETIPHLIKSFLYNSRVLSEQELFSKAINISLITKNDMQLSDIDGIVLRGDFTRK